jgi:hypothetical protein
MPLLHPPNPPLLLLLRHDLIDAFQAGRFEVLRPDLACGKGLTNQVSQAHRIGPKCAGTFSEQLPFVLRPTEQAALAGAP